MASDNGVTYQLNQVEPHACPICPGVVCTDRLSLLIHYASDRHATKKTEILIQSLNQMKMVNELENANLSDEYTKLKKANLCRSETCDDYGNGDGNGDEKGQEQECDNDLVEIELPPTEPSTPVAAAAAFLTPKLHRSPDLVRSLHPCVPPPIHLGPYEPPSHTIKGPVRTLFSRDGVDVVDNRRRELLTNITMARPVPRSLLLSTLVGSVIVNIDEIEADLNASYDRIRQLRRDINEIKTYLNSTHCVYK